MSKNESRYLDATSPVRSGEELDADRLKAYLAANNWGMRSKVWTSSSFRRGFPT